MPCGYRPPRRTSSRRESRNSLFWGWWPFLLMSADHWRTTMAFSSEYSAGSFPECRSARSRTHPRKRECAARPSARRQHVPVAFVFREIQKIILTIDFKLQFLFSLKPVAPASRRLSRGHPPSAGRALTAAGTAALRKPAGESPATTRVLPTSLGLDGSETRPHTALLKLTADS